MTSEIFFLFMWFGIMAGAFALAGFIAEYFFKEGK